jgi:AraC-like DNA-binding protein/endonuclease/exonuclease/phosphatase family metal-dependent hydrolase
VTAADAAAGAAGSLEAFPPAGELPAGDATAGCPVCGCRPAQPHPGLPPGRAGLLLAWLAGNYRRPLRAAEIAAAAGLSVRALQATCQREFGRTPFQLLTDIRLHHARLALTTSEPQPGSVAEVARSAGFATRLTRFTAAYRRRYGTPPVITARITPGLHDIPPATPCGQHSRAGCPAAGPVPDRGRHSLPRRPSGDDMHGSPGQQPVTGQPAEARRAALRVPSASLGDGALRICAVNLSYGGLDRDSGSDQRWHKTVEALTAWAPHVVLVQEMTALHPHGLHAHLWRTASALGMIPLLGPPTPVSVSGNHPAILVDYDAGLRVLDQGPPPWLPGAGAAPAWAWAVLQVPGLSHLLHVYSVHLPARTAAGQREQAERLASRIAQDGALAVAGGDWNCYAPGDEGLTPGVLAALPPHLRPARMRATADGQLAAVHDVHEVLAAIGMSDIAASLPPGCRSPRQLTGTGSCEHGRIDRFYASGGLERAAVRYEQASTGGSDHQALLLILDTAAASALTLRPCAP